MYLKNRGLIASYDDYCELPLSVLEDARILRLHEASIAAQEDKRRKARR